MVNRCFVNVHLRSKKAASVLEAQVENEVAGVMKLVSFRVLAM